MGFSTLEETKIINSIVKSADALVSIGKSAATLANAYVESVRKQPDLSSQPYTIVVNVEGTEFSSTTSRIEEALKYAERLRRPQDK